MQQIRMRAHPTDISPDGQVTAEVVANYRRAQVAIYDVRRSVQRFVIIDESYHPTHTPLWRITRRCIWVTSGGFYETVPQRIR
jgi:hypothetical protein